MATALITGASSGIGKEFAWQLATEGHDLVLVARRADKLGTLAHQLRAATQVRVEVEVADLAQEADVKRVAARLASATRPVSLLVNNAGASPGRLLQRDLDTHLAKFDVMVRAVLILSRAGAAAMVSRGVGAIVNVGSVAGTLAAGPYSAHKAWVQVFTESLAGELAGTGVRAMVLQPGPVRTEFFDSVTRGQGMYPPVAWVDIERLVQTALADLRIGKVISTPTLRYKAVATLMSKLPRPLVRLASRLQGGL